MARGNCKKYMKQNSTKDHTLLKTFIFSFFGMLLVFTYLIKSFTPEVDVSIGDYKQESQIESDDEIKKNVDNRLAMIQDEDQGRNFSDLMKKAEEAEKIAETKKEEQIDETEQPKEDISEAIKAPAPDPVYKVFIGTYTSAEQAKVAKDIIQESGSNLTPIVKCLGSNNYTLQVGIFKNKQSADSLLHAIQKNHLPGRVVQEY